MHADLADLCDVRNEAFGWVFQCRGLSRDSFDGGDEHFVREKAGAGEDDAETDTGEGGGVVAFGFFF